MNYELQPTARLMLYVFRRFEDILTEKLAMEGFTDIKPSHFNILRHLNPEGMRQVDLAKDAGVTKQAVGKMISELQQCGYVSLVEDDEDKRAKKVVYTGKGKKLIDASISIVKEMEVEFGDRLGIDNYANLRTGLVVLLESLADMQK